MLSLHKKRNNAGNILSLLKSTWFFCPDLEWNEAFTSLSTVSFSSVEVSDLSGVSLCFILLLSLLQWVYNSICRKLQIWLHRICPLHQGAYKDFPYVLSLAKIISNSHFPQQILQHSKNMKKEATILSCILSADYIVLIYLGIRVQIIF